MSIRRQTISKSKMSKDPYFDLLVKCGVKLLPNTSGCRTAKDAIWVAEMAREAFGTNRIKLEVTGDDDYLQPDPFELLEAARELCRQGFEVFAYSTDDLCLTQRLFDVGCVAVMPWGSPIGSGRGLSHPFALQALRKRFPSELLIIDAGIGKPSHAAEALEMGFDAVLVNTAIARANDPVKMASAFAAAVQAGRGAYEAGMIHEIDFAEPSSPVVGQPFWHHA